MALIQTNFYSTALKLNTHLTIMHPGDSAKPEHPDTVYPVIFLLHGHGGNNLDYLIHSNAARYARNRRAILVCPEVHNSFYTDMKYGRGYFTYLTEEMPRALRRFFGFEWKRELVSAVGLSMGAYGAFYLALSRPDLFQAAGAISGPLDIHRLIADIKNGERWRLPELMGILGEDAVVPESGDLFKQVERMASFEQRPRLAACVGQEDFLYEHTIRFLDHCHEQAYPLEFWESPGEHNWEYWDDQLEPMMDFCLKS